MQIFRIFNTSRANARAIRLVEIKFFSSFLSKHKSCSVIDLVCREANILVLDQT